MFPTKLVRIATVVFLWAFVPANANAAGSIAGQVTLEDGSPAAGAIVEWRSLDATEGLMPSLLHDDRAVCGKDGSFRFEKMRKGPYRVQATARPPKAKSDWYVVVPDVKDGTTNLQIVVKRGSPVRGQVVDMDGKPVRSFSVLARQNYVFGTNGTASSGPEPQTFEDPEGRFVFESLPDGDWEFSVRTEGPRPAKSVKVHLPSKETPTIRLVADLTPRLTPGPVTGRVVDANGQPVKGARVRIGMQTEVGVISISGDDQETTSDEKGAFRFERVQEPFVQLRADKEGTGRSELFLLDRTKPAPGDLTLVLKAGGKLSGTVVDAAGKPVAGCTLVAELEGDPDLVNAPTATSDAQGRFEFQDLLPGSYQVTGMTDKSHPLGELYGDANATVEGGKTAEVALKLRKFS